MTRFMSFSPKQATFQHPFFGASFFNDDVFSKDFASFVPAVNIAENEKEFRLEVSAPGFTKTDFKLKAEEHTLTISAVHEEVKTDEKEKFSRQEFRKGSFSRSFRLPKDQVNTEAISAKYENGILFVSIPKKTEQPKNNTVEIQVA